MSSRPVARLLLVDNNPDYVDPLRDRLLRDGWRADVARSPEEALERVRAARYQICLLDKRLRNDHDETDRSGLDLPKPLWNSDGLLHFVLLTKFPEFRDVRQSMKGRFAAREERCVGFVGKDDGYQALVDELTRVLEEEVKVNWEIEISADVLAAVVDPLLRETQPELRVARRQKFEQDADLLLRSIFHSARSLECELLDVQGRSGARILRVTVDARDSWVVKVATRLATEEEWQNFRDYVEPASILRHPNVPLGMCQFGSYLGAIAYAQVSELNRATPLNDLHDFVAESPEAEDRVRGVLHQLVESASPWVRRERTTAPRDLTAYYQAHFQLDLDDLERRFLELNLNFPDLGRGPELSGEALGGTVLDPLAFAARTRFVVESDWNVCHGDLNAANVLVPQGIPYFIDFASTGPGPTCLDWVTLEASLKFGNAWGTEPEAWFRLEEALVLQNNLEQPVLLPDGVEPRFAALLAAITTLRGEVARQVQPRGGLLEYLVGLFYATLYQVRFYGPKKERNRKAYRILASAGLLAERLAGMAANRPDLGLVVRWQSAGGRALPAGLGDPPAEDSAASRVEALQIQRERLLRQVLTEVLGRKAPVEREVDLPTLKQKLEELRDEIRRLSQQR